MTKPEWATGFKIEGLRQLLRHAGPIEQALVLSNQPVRVKATDVNIADLDLLACGWHPKEVTWMGCLHRADRHDLVTFGNHKINGEFLVREGGAKHAREQLETVAVPCHFGRQVRIVVRAMRREVGISAVHIASIDDLIVQRL